jgi:hypothetical protein
MFLNKAISHTQMPDTRALTLMMEDGTYKPINSFFEDAHLSNVATCESGEYLLLE